MCFFRFALLTTFIAVTSLLSGCATNQVQQLVPADPATLSPASNKAFFAGSMKRINNVTVDMNTTLIFESATPLPGSDKPVRYTLTVGELSASEIFFGSALAHAFDTNSKKDEVDSVFVIELPPGKYYLRNISCYGAQLFVHALIDFAVPMELKAGEVSYIGALTVETIRPDNYRDYMASGQVQVSDEFQRDRNLILRQYATVSPDSLKDRTLPVTYISPLVVRY